MMTKLWVVGVVFSALAAGSAGVAARAAEMPVKAPPPVVAPASSQAAEMTDAVVARLTNVSHHYGATIALDDVTTEKIGRAAGPVDAASSARSVDTAADPGDQCLDWENP